MDDQGWMKIHFHQLEPEDDLILWSLPIPLVLCSLHFKILGQEKARLLIARCQVHSTLRVRCG